MVPEAHAMIRADNNYYIEPLYLSHTPKNKNKKNFIESPKPYYDYTLFRSPH